MSEGLVYKIPVTQARVEFFTDPRFIYRNVPFIDPDFYRRHNPKHYGYAATYDHVAVPKTIIQSLGIEFPENIYIQALDYKTWKISTMFYNDPLIITRIIKESVVLTDPENFNLIGLCKRRPLFWKSLFDIIQRISGFEFDLRDEELKLSKKVELAQKRYASSLDGLYDSFVMLNAPTMYEYYRGLTFHERLDFLGLMQYSTGVDVYLNLQNVRMGKVKTMKLTPGEQRNMPPDLREKGIPAEALTESAEKLRERLRKDKKFKTKKRIFTENENLEFSQADS